MNEEETNEVELLKKWIGLKDTGLCYVTFKIEEVEILLNLISKLQKELDKKDKVIDLILKFMVEELIYDADLDYIYGKMNNCNGLERSITRKDEEEIKMLKEYFYKKVEEENETNRI